MMDISVNKDWTEEEVWAAEEEYILNGGESWGINSPFLRWSSLHKLDKYQLRYENGDKFALMLALRTCILYEFVMPEWVANSFLDAINRIADYEEKSWDDVFGRPNPKGARITDLRAKRLLEGKVYYKAMEIILNNPERAVHADLFDEVAEEFGIGRTAAEDYYRSMIRKGCEPLTKIKQDIDAPRNQIRKKMLQKPPQE